MGTHALTTGSRSTLAQRLRQHRGSPRGGNHRGSIFRLLIGQATLASAPGLVCPSWGIKAQSREAATALATTRDQINEWEKAVEIEVSQLLSRMRIVVLGCEDEPGPDSLRGYVERNSIALLSAAHRAGLDRTSSEWLGQHSNRSLVVSSGLWNQRHTTETADVNFLERFQRIVQFGVRIDVVP